MGIEEGFEYNQNAVDHFGRIHAKAVSVVKSEYASRLEPWKLELCQRAAYSTYRDLTNAGFETEARRISQDSAFRKRIIVGIFLLTGRISHIAQYFRK